MNNDLDSLKSAFARVTSCATSSRVCRRVHGPWLVKGEGFAVEASVLEANASHGKPDRKLDQWEQRRRVWVPLLLVLTAVIFTLFGIWLQGALQRPPFLNFAD
jgi:hypothetical protein